MHLLWLALSAALAVAPTSTLTVTVSGAKSDKGSMLISVFDKAAGFPDNVLLAASAGKTDISKGRAEITFALEPGKYAVAVAHDANNNDRLDKNALGIPTEGFGFSGNPKAVMGPPKFEKALLNVKPGANKIEIKLKYP